MPVDPIQAFIDRWSPSGGAERANYSLFLSDLCDILEVPRPEPTRPEDDDNAYVFERRVVFTNPDASHSFGRIDLYKRGCFILETKQGVEEDDKQLLLSDAASERKKRRLKGHGTRGTAAWNDTLLRARGQAEQYARSLTTPETRPPFLVVVDVGHTIDLYAEFTQTGGTYTHFPDATSSRIKLAQFTDPEIRARLRAIWTDPLSLDPARRSAKVTREIAAKLAELAKSFEAEKHDPHEVAQFLMRCLFTMFAEDVELLPKNGFRDMLKTLDDPAQFKPMVEDLWRQMNVGGFSAYFRKKLLHFNGGLFVDPSALAINRVQLELLIEAADKDWRDVEPAIFGTLLERALDPVERHKLGAHYTPRAYVERLVMPTIVEPIRAEWDNVRTAAILHAQEGDRDAAVKELTAFHDRLCETRVLDPACGTGNFLYVTLEHLKRIEGEVFSTFQSIAERQILLESGHTVDPHQLLGIEINPRAAAIADLVLWIGYLQWHFRTRGNVNPPEPVIKNFKNIECRDALLTWSSRAPELEDGKPVTHWDGRTTKIHPVTGEDVPDETAREISYKYNNPKKSDWPSAAYIVGNPPYLGARVNRLALGDGYLQALRSTYEDVPENCDYVMYWWYRSAQILQKNGLQRSGLITTKSISQPFAVKLTEPFLTSSSPVSYSYAIPNHPWVDSANGADVRVALSVTVPGNVIGRLQRVVNEHPAADGEIAVALETANGKILPNLTIGVDVLSASLLKANDGISCVGYQLSGKGFVIPKESLLSVGFGDSVGIEKVVRPLLTARDIVQTTRGHYAADLCGLEIESVRTKFPALFQWVVERVKPERDYNNRESVRQSWWLFGEQRKTFRPAIAGIRRIVATPLTAKHRVFTLCDAQTICDSTSVMFAVDDTFQFGVLSSRIHVTWALVAGGRLGVGDDPRYLKVRCFEPFPFPDTTEPQKSRIRELGEQLDSHRKRQQQLHPTLTMTGMYNVLEKLRAGEPLTSKEQTIHEQGLASVLRQIHDDLDTAVADAYGWPTDLTDEEILTRLVALNHQRADEERRGIIRYLRPDFQNPTGQKQTALDVGQAVPDAPAVKPAKQAKQTWPKTLSEQAGAVHTALSALPTGASAEEVSKAFGRRNAKRTERIEEILETLAALGKARVLDNERYIGM